MANLIICILVNFNIQLQPQVFINYFYVRYLFIVFRYYGARRTSRSTYQHPTSDRNISSIFCD